MKKTFLLDSILIISLGALTSLSLPPYNFFLINFLTFSIFFIFLFKKQNNIYQKKLFFYYGWLFGFSYFSTNIYWITISLTFDENLRFLIPIAQMLIPAFLALFYGIVTFFFYVINLKKILSSFFLFTLLFGLVEFLRGNVLTGFPWNLIIYSFSESLNFISLISVIGTYSLNLFVITLFTAPAILIIRKSKVEFIVFIIIFLIPVISYIYNSFYKQNFLKKEIKKNPQIIRIIGSNISLDRFYENSQSKAILKELVKLSSPEKNKKILFLWPEGIISDLYQDELDIYKDIISKNFNKNHLIGLGITSRFFKGSKYEFFNSFIIFDYNLNIIENYKKINLVPFGEFLPFEDFFNKLGLRTITNDLGSYEKGKYRNIIQINKEFGEIKFLPLICYEIIYSGKLTKDFNFDFILNISEDGWFGESIGPKQHFVHSIFRAIESGKYIVRSSNNGMAAIINPLGEIEKKIDYGKDGFIDFEESRVVDTTIFSVYGNKIFFLIILLYIFLVFSFNRIKNE